MARASVSNMGARVVFDSVGTGPPLVLIHGWSTNRSYWRPQQVLAADYQVISIDLAGHGESSAGRDVWTMAAYGSDVVAVLNELSIDGAVLVGHSMGGNAALEAARELGHRVRLLIWLDTYGRLDVPAGARPVDEFIAPFRTDFVETTRRFVGEMFLAEEDAETAHTIVEDMAAAPPDVAVASLHHSLTYGRTASHLMDELSTPVIAINTDYLGADIESLERYGVQVRLFSNSGHFPMLLAPERLNSLLAELCQPHS